MSLTTLRRIAILTAFLCVIVPARAETIVALMSDAKLRHFSSTAPNAWIKTVDISGIAAGQTPVAMDFRPDGSLIMYTREGTTTTLRPYAVDPNTGVATVGPFTSVVASANSAAI